MESLVSSRPDKADAQDCKQDRTGQVVTGKAFADPADDAQHRAGQKPDSKAYLPFVPIHRKPPRKIKVK